MFARIFCPKKNYLKNLKVFNMCPIFATLNQRNIIFSKKYFLFFHNLIRNNILITEVFSNLFSELTVDRPLNEFHF